MLSVKVEEEGVKCEQLERVVIGDDREKFFQIEVQLPHREKEELIDFLRKNINVFAWSAYKASGVDLDFICHHLNFNPSVVPKRQSPRCSSKEHSDTVRMKYSNLSGLVP